MKKAAKFTIIGTVQGVFFRKFVKDNADSLGLYGYARNLENGSVEVFVEGEQEKIDNLERLLRQGPKHANVREVKKEELKWSGEFKNFKILKF